MDKRLYLAALLIVAGIVHLLLPLYFTMTGLVLCALGAGTAGLVWLDRRGREGLHDGLLAAMGCGVIGLVICMSLIQAGGYSDWQDAETANYAIVLGCQVKADNTPSRALAARIDQAAELLERNPAVTVIVSGGKGDDENKSEAQCMFDELTVRDPDWADRILMEDRATDTRENFRDSLELLDDLGWTDSPIVVVTSEYHMARARYIAGTMDLDIYPVSSITTPYVFRFNYYLREVFAFVKAFAKAAS
jgi:uncharacterized SAM-binding protein YcdF (DUF218 family)